MSTCASIIADRNQTTEEGNSNNKAITIVANHSQRRRRFKVPGSTHWPSARQRDGGPYRLQKANPSDSRAAALSPGRHGSRAVGLPIQAPLNPSKIGRAPCRGRVCQYEKVTVGALANKKKKN